MNEFKLPATWDRGKAVRFTVFDYNNGQGQIEVEPGLRFFVLWLAALGARSRCGCEGHAGGFIDKEMRARRVPWAFYLTFDGPQWLAHKIACSEHFRVMVCPDFDRWAVHLEPAVTMRQRDCWLRKEALIWSEKFKTLISIRNLQKTVKLLPG